MILYLYTHFNAPRTVHDENPLFLEWQWFYYRAYSYPMPLGLLPNTSKDCLITRRRRRALLLPYFEKHILELYFIWWWWNLTFLYNFKGLLKFLKGWYFSQQWLSLYAAYPHVWPLLNQTRLEFTYVVHCIVLMNCVSKIDS